MDIKSLILGNDWDYRIERRKPNEVRFDKGRIVEDGDTGEKMVKLKSDGQKFPKPSEDKIDVVTYRKWWHKLLFVDKKYAKGLTLIDNGDGEGDFVEYDRDDNKASEAGSNRMFDTHKDMRVKKYMKLTEEEDNTEMWFAGYVTVVALMTAGALYIIVTGVKGSIASSVKAGLEAGLQGADVAQQQSDKLTGPSMGNNATNIIPVIGLMSLTAFKSLKERVSALVGLGK